MATENVQQWITREMKLSKVVTSFESDFSNGYLFGEILQRYGLIDDLSTFSKKTGKESKVKNFQQVESVLRELKVRFDGKVIHQIMNEERGASLRLLYQLKLAIEKADIGGIDASKKTMTGLNQGILNRKLEETLNLKSSLPLTSKLSTVNGAKKLAPIEKSMLPYEHRKMLLEQKAFDDQRKEEQLVMSLYMETREEERRKMEENKEFMTDWLKEGHKNWRTNQKKRADAIARVKYFEDREVKAYKDKLQNELDEATRELMGGVDEFERNLQKLGIEKNTNIEDAIKRMEEKKGIPPGQIQNFSYAATMNKIKEKKNMQDFAAKERDRRRRKMVVDQTKTQSELDRKKNEEVMIEKLLKQQEEEQKMAYLEVRQRQCKELIVESRRIKAFQQEEKRVIQIAEIEKKRAETMPEQIAKHKQGFTERKKDFTVLRRDEKAKKRGLDIEICSEVVDLILDIANEAFDESRKEGKGGKLDKPTWREWMRYFKDNKLVSKARRGLLNQDQDGLFMMRPATDLSEAYDVLEDLKRPIDEVLDVIKGEQCHNDMLEYMSATGIFNLTDGARFEEWNEFGEFIASSTTLDASVLQQVVPPVNPQMGTHLHKILSKDKQNASQTEVTSPHSGIPNYLNLKLCILGRSCAGKRTLAKQLQELYPKLKAFRMEELIKEVVEYVSPKPVADAAATQDKGKKAPPPKGKVEEAAPVDPYAGLDTKEYKEIGHQIKKYLGEGELPAGTDMVSLIPDDKLLVNLFIQKLKLTFPADKADDVKIEEIKAGLAKEKELLEQLAELEAANAAGAADPKAAKGGKAPPAKGGKGPGGPSGEEQIKAELDAIQKVSAEGWLLLDFPRTLSQAKAFENMMTGFTPLIDDPESKRPQRTFEQWSKIVSPNQTIGLGNPDVSYNGEPFVYQSGTDGYFFLDVPTSECQRRISHRKIDPTTGTVYHMEDNPPPEGDPKLRDRLQDYAGEPEQENSRVTHNHQVFDANVDSIKQWAANFALYSEDSPQVEGVNLKLEVEIEEKTKKEEVFERASKLIGKVIGYKQALFDEKRARVKNSLEITVTAENIDAAEEQKAEGAEASQEPPMASRNDLLEVTQSKKSLQNSIGGGEHSVMNATQRSTYTFKQSQPLSSAQKVIVWRQFETEYYRECLQVFKAVRKQRKHVFDGLTMMQTQFIENYLSKVDIRQSSLIQDFIDSFNKFSEEFPNLRSDPLTQEELRKRVTRLSNDMWTLVEQKKDQALSQHDKLNSDGWVVGEMRKLMKNACRIIQVELQRFFVLQSLVTGVMNQLEVDLEKTLENFSDDGIKTIDENEHSPLFHEILAYSLRVVQGRKEALDILEGEHAVILRPELDALVHRISLIRTWILLKVKEFNQFWRQLYEVLDDGIVTAIKIENEATQSVIQRIQEHMNEQSISGVFHPMDYSDFRIPYLDLESQIERMDFSGAEVPLYMQTPAEEYVEPAELRLKIGQLEQLYTGLRYYAYQEFLDVQTFVHQVVLLFQSNILPQQWRQYDFSILAQVAASLKLEVPGEETNIYSSQIQPGQREFFDWRKLLTMFILIGAPFPETSLLNEYRNKLSDVASADDDSVKLEQFIEVPAWFDDFESIQQDPAPLVAGQPNGGDSKTIDDAEEDEDEDEGPKIPRDFQRLRDIKAMLFRVHQTNTKVVRVSDVISSLTSLFSMASGHTNFHTYLFKPASF